MPLTIRKRPPLHQPTKSEMEEVVQVEGTPEQIARAVLTGGAPRRPAPAAAVQAFQKPTQTDER